MNMQPNILMDIVAHKRQELDANDAGAKLLPMAQVPLSTRSLKDTLSSPEPCFIMECKKASPTLGSIRPDTLVDSIAKLYGKKAGAVSVLTDKKYFGGALADIEVFAQHVGVPILAKDFFIEKNQIIQARLAGADVVLLMLSVLNDSEYLELKQVAVQLNLDIVTEVHTEAELERAIALKADIIGINNRDLKTLKTDINITKKLAPKIPKDSFVISQSGIENRQDILALAPYVDGFLVGSSIMSAPNIETKINELIYGKVKVCGLTNIADAQMALAAGASYGGLIFVPESPRYVNDKVALHISQNCELPMVGVFKGCNLDNIINHVNRYSLVAVQLHGKFDPKLCQALCEMLPAGVEVWPSYAVNSKLPNLTGKTSHIHLDTFDAKKAGGTGRSFNWDLIKDHKHKEKLVLAGGIGADNILPAALTFADIIDINSAVESAAGIKDPSLMGICFDRLRRLDGYCRQKKSAQLGTNPAGYKSVGYFGDFGGSFVPEILVPVLENLEEEFIKAQADPAFCQELSQLLKNYAGRETPLTLCRNLGVNSGVKIYLKREDLLHGGAHKTNQVLAQALLAKRMGKKRIIAETGAGQHGVAVALASALLGLDAYIYMGAEDVARQQANVFRMELFGATVIPVTTSSATLKDAVNEAMRDWTASYQNTHYLLGTAAGPHPFPTMVRDFQRIIGDEARAQILATEGRLPDVAVACVGGGSNAIGLFTAFLDDKTVALHGVEAGGEGLDTNRHGATLCQGSLGVLHGSKTKILQDVDGQISPSHSISAGLDYPAVGPEHAHLQASGRATYVSVTDTEALDAFNQLAKCEGIIPALESAHAVAHALKLAPTLTQDSIILINLSGRGDKDLEHVRALNQVGETS